MNYPNLLADTPEIVRDQDMGTISKIGNKSKGVNSSKKINQWGRRLQAQWMVKEAYVQNEEDEDSGLLNLHKVRSIGYIKEAIAWNPDVNADRVSAMGVLMILRADRERMDLTYEPEAEKGLESDKFWDKSFNGGKSYIDTKNFGQFFQKP